MVGAGRFERPTPCAQGIGCPHLGINRFNNLRTLLVGPCGNFSYNLDCKAAIRLVKPPTTPTGSPAGSADCEINQRGRAYVVTAGSLEGPSIAGFKLGDPPAFAAGGLSGRIPMPNRDSAGVQSVGHGGARYSAGVHNADDHAGDSGPLPSAFQGRTL